jgi:flavin-dependent dehydrogenase
MNTYPADQVVAPALGQKAEIRGSYDVAIVGGGLAGLSLSIQMAKQGYSTILFEKEQYPFHRVCGEYISLESWNFLESLGYPLSEMNLPLIKNLLVSSPAGKVISHALTPGGFGISRFKLDDEMADLARRNGVHLLEEHKVTDVVFTRPVFDIHCSSLRYQAKVVCGTFGKRSNLDIKWKRPFTDVKPGKLNNYVGVKYHVRTDFPADTIALHNFENGYCGISRIEDGKYCVCYLTTARNLKASENSIRKLEENILQRNPFLKRAFSECEMLYSSPVTISQISFQRKSLVENHVLMVGDAGGMITPLCGNGMSMALHGSKLAAGLIHRYLSRDISQSALEQEYIQQWKRLFSRRLQMGRLIQRFFGKEALTNIFINSIKPFPNFISYLIRQTHGEPF